MTQHIAQTRLGLPILGAAGIVASVISPVPGRLKGVVIKLKGGTNPNGAANFKVYVEGEEAGTLVLNPDTALTTLDLDVAVAQFAEVTITAPLIPSGGLAAPLYFLLTFEDSQGAIKRSAVEYVTPAIANGGTDNTYVQLGRGFVTYRVQTSAPARVRLYTRASYRIADALRPYGTPPIGEHGVILDVQTTPDNLVIDLANPLTGASLEDVVTDDIATAITNLSGLAQAITVTITRAVIEGAGASSGFMLTVSEVADVPLVVAANKLYVSAGDVVELEEAGAVRIKTASDVIIPTAGIMVSEEDDNPALANVQEIVVGIGDLLDLGGGVARLLTAGDALEVITALLGVASGIATLNGAGKVPLAQLLTAVANGLATLDAGAKVPVAQIPATGGDVSGAINAITVDALRGRGFGGIPTSGGFLQDTFDGGVIDDGKWAGGGATQHDGHLFTPSGGTTTSNIGTPNFTDKFISCRIHPAAQFVWRVRWGNLAGNDEYIQIWFRPGEDIRVGYRTTATGSIWIAGFGNDETPYVEANFAYLRVEHKTATGKVHIYRSPTGIAGTWVELGNFVPPVSIAAIDVWYLDLGGAGNSYIDDVDSNLPIADPILGKNLFGILWDNVATHFGMFRTLGILPYTASGAPPVGAPTNLPPGHTVAIYEGGATRKHHVWNIDTATWDEQAY